MAATATTMISAPSCEIVFRSLRVNDGDPSKLLNRYPNFDSDAIPGAHEMHYIHHACSGQHLSAVRGLLHSGVNLLFKDDDGFTALNLACSNMSASSEECALLLLQYSEARSTVNVAEDDGWTPLHNAVYDGGACLGISVAKALIACGADPTLENNEGRTPLEVVRDEVCIRQRNNQYFTQNNHTEFIRPVNNPTQIIEVLEAAERVHAVLALGEWRPSQAAAFPRSYRSAMRTLLILAKARPRAQRRVIVGEDGTRRINARYLQGCLHLLPEEILQYLFAYVSVAPVPDVWTLHDVTK